MRDYAPPVNSSEFLVFHNSERREGHLVNYLPNSHDLRRKYSTKSTFIPPKGPPERG